MHSLRLELNRIASRGISDPFHQQLLAAPVSAGTRISKCTMVLTQGAHVNHCLSLEPTDHVRAHGLREAHGPRAVCPHTSAVGCKPRLQTRRERVLSGNSTHGLITRGCWRPTNNPTEEFALIYRQTRVRLARIREH